MTLRFKELLDTHRLELNSLSERALLSPERIQELLAGSEPSLRELRLLAKALKVPVSEIALWDRRKRELPFLFRAPGFSVQGRNPLALEMISNKIEYALELLGPSHVEPPWWLDRFGESSSSYADAEENARAFREIFFDDDQASPILALPGIILEKMDVLLFVIDAAGVDGASVFVERIPFIFVSRRFQARMLFTLAHEVAHLISTRRPATDFVRVDEGSELDVAERQPRDQSEQYAHAFASCLLMPGPGVGIALQKIREIYEIKSERIGDIEVLLLSRIFGLSFVAAARRCEDLRLLPRGGAESLNEWMNKEFGSPEKRAMNVGLPPRPNVDFPIVPRQLLSAAVQQVRSGAISIGRAASMLGLSISELMLANESGFS